MASRVGRLTVTVLAALLVVPGRVGAQSLDPSVVTSAPDFVRAVAAFVVVAVVGGWLLARRRGAVDNAVQDTVDRPKVAVVYGLVAFALVGVLGLFANNLLVQSGLVTTPLALLVVVIPLVGVAVVGGLGFLVVGTLLTGLNGQHRPRHGVVFGAALSAACWVAVPLLASVVAWLLVAAFGVGGTTRTWVHSERTVAAETD